MRKLLGMALCAALCTAPAIGFAEDCVEVDVELTPVTSPDSGSTLQFYEFSIELTNCGTEPAMAELAVVLETGSPSPIPPVRFMYPIGAGETASRSWVLPLPPAVPPGTYEVCVTATIGDATDSDCATLEVSDASGTWSLPGTGLGVTPAGTLSEDCVEVDVELTPTTFQDASGLQAVEFSLELTNCGTEPALAGMTFELNIGLPLPPFTFYLPIGAGETIAHSWVLPLPPIVPAGTYGACVTAVIGEATSSDCASIEVDSGEGMATIPEDESATLDQNYPNPFNAGSNITFSLTDATDISLTIHNILGQRVASLAGGTYAPGTHTVMWDGRNAGGSTVASGMYFYRLVAGSTVLTRKMMFLK